MTVPPTNHNRKFVDFLRDNCPTAPDPQVDLDRQLMQKLSIESRDKPRFRPSYRWGIYSAIAAGCLLSAANVSFKKPELVVETLELEEFLVNSWNETLKARSLAILEEPEIDWLLPTNHSSQTSAEASVDSGLRTTQSKPALSLSAR